MIMKDPEQIHKARLEAAEKNFEFWSAQLGELCDEDAWQAFQHAKAVLAQTVESAPRIRERAILLNEFMIKTGVSGDKYDFDALQAHQEAFAQHRFPAPVAV